MSAFASSTATQTSPLLCVIMKCMLSWVIMSAAPMRSPSFSRSSSSSTTTKRPAATSARASSMEAKPGVGVSGSSSAGLASGCQLGVCARTTNVALERDEREILARRARELATPARGRGGRSAAAGALADLATARGAHLAAVNAAETVVIAAIVGGVCRATFVLGTCARRQLTALARAIISRDISGPEEASCASVGPESLPFGRPVCGLAMRAGARTSGWGAHACCVPSASGPGAQGESRRKKRRSVFENPKIDGCEIFWRLKE